MPLESEGTEQDTQYVYHSVRKVVINRRISDVTSSLFPAYLCSPTPELTGFKLFKYKLKWTFTNKVVPYRYQSAVRNKQNFVKRGARVRLQEALVLEFIAQNTTIPVPRVLDVFSYQGKIHIVEERIDGPVLEDVWHLLSPEEKHSCLMQIKDYLQQMRSLKPPHPERVQAIDGSGIIDRRLKVEPWGPFDNHHDFHRWLYGWDGVHPHHWPKLQEALLKIAGKNYKTVFSHGDFGPHNMILSHGKVFIIDWEMAGWLPEYWDYTRSYTVRGHFHRNWWKVFKEVWDQYDDEVEVHVQTVSLLSC